MESTAIIMIAFAVIFGAVIALVIDSVTKGMYLPRHWHQVFPVSVILFGFYLKQRIGDTFDMFVTMLFLQSAGLMHGYYITRAGILYQGYITEMNTPDTKPVKMEAEPEMPTVKTYTPIIVNQQIFELPRLDTERRFSIDVLRMYDFDPATQKHVDLTEERWVIQKKMFSQKPFANMKKKWEHFGLLVRKSESKNSKFIVASRDAVAMVASGNPLPDWSPPPPQ
jgi:hypothetical protein